MCEYQKPLNQSPEICASQKKDAILKDAVYITAQPQDAAQKTASVLAPESRNTSNISEGSQRAPHGAADNPFMPEIVAGKEGVEMTGKDETLAEAPALSKALGMALEAAPRKTLTLDTAKYQEMLDDPSLSEAQKEQIIEALWKIIVCFVDLGFGVSPLEDACGQLTQSDDQGHDAGGDVVSSRDHTLSETFNDVAAE